MRSYKRTSLLWRAAVDASPRRWSEWLKGCGRKGADMDGKGKGEKALFTSATAAGEKGAFLNPEAFTEEPPLAKDESEARPQSFQPPFPPAPPRSRRRRTTAPRRPRRRRSSISPRRGGKECRRRRRHRVPSGGRGGKGRERKSRKIPIPRGLQEEQVERCGGASTELRAHPERDPRRERERVREKACGRWKGHSGGSLGGLGPGCERPKARWLRHPFPLVLVLTRCGHAQLPALSFSLLRAHTGD